MPNYKSGFERTLAASLKRRGVKFEYEARPLAYTIAHKYHPDFFLPNGIIVEAKGRFMPGDVPKMKAVKAAYPDLDIRFVFSNAHAKIPGQKQTYATWADRHGFPWADKEIPDEWLKPIS